MPSLRSRDSKNTALATLRQVAGCERGSVTAEFALTLPAVVLLLAVGLGAITLAGQRVSLTGQAAEAARLAARGDTQLAQEILTKTGAHSAVSRANGILCVTLTATHSVGKLRLLPVSGKGCAAESTAAQ